MNERTLPRPLLITGFVILAIDLLLAPLIDPWIYGLVRNLFLGLPAEWSQHAVILVRFSEIGFFVAQWALVALWRALAADEVYDDSDYLALLLFGAQALAMGTGLVVRFGESTVACGLLCVEAFGFGLYVLCGIVLGLFRRRTRGAIRVPRVDDTAESPRLFQFRIIHWMIGTAVLAAWLQIGANSGFLAVTLAILSLPILVPAYLASSLLCLTLAVLAMSRRAAWSGVALVNGLVWPLIFFTALYGCEQLVSESPELLTAVFSFSGAIHVTVLSVLVVARGCGYRLVVAPLRKLEEVWDASP